MRRGPRRPAHQRTLSEIMNSSSSRSPSAKPAAYPNDSIIGRRCITCICEVDLEADVVDGIANSRRPRSPWTARLQTAQNAPTARRTPACRGLEAQRRQVPFEHGFGEGPAADRVDLETRHAQDFAVALCVSIVDVVVAEASEEEVRERVVTVAGGSAECVTPPDRGMPEQAARIRRRTVRQVRARRRRRRRRRARARPI